jgi:hypothetical protein
MCDISCFCRSKDWDYWWHKLTGKLILSIPGNCASRMYSAANRPEACRDIQIQAQLAEALRQKTGGSGFDSRSDSWQISSAVFLLSAFSSPGVHSAP